jgi:hypothetical protein
LGGPEVSSLSSLHLPVRPAFYKAGFLDSLKRGDVLGKICVFGLLALFLPVYQVNPYLRFFAPLRASSSNSR